MWGDYTASPSGASTIAPRREDVLRSALSRQEGCLGVDREKLFVKAGIEQKVITDGHLKKAHEYQANQRVRGVEMGVGEALMDLKLLNKIQYLSIQRAIHYKLQRNGDKVLARVIIESDYAPKQEVLDAMAYQKDQFGKDGGCRPVGDILIERGFLTVEQLKAAQKIQALKVEDED
jgi:hypothetical protein